jgi:predicted O-linked N-acetylglucosamine transferase (SPINDLY family)
MIAELKRHGYQIYLYSNHGKPDHVTAMFKSHAAQFRQVVGVRDDDLARLIADDQIDVLFDLSGHTGGHRLAVMAREPAPLQITWLGHPASTGMTSIHARLTDEVADPPAADKHYAERLWRLQGTFCVYRPLVDRPQDRVKPEYQVRTTPALALRRLTFGCCNNMAKMTPPVVKLWARVLEAVPGSRILLEAPGLFGSALRSMVMQRFADEGVDVARVELLDRDTSKQYLTYHQIDIALDPFPCNGGTTSFDVLWMGVPLVTLAGDAFAGRMGASLVNGVGYPDWACIDAEAYVAKAAELASDWEALNRIRLGLRERVENGPLGDEQAYGDKVSQVLQAMWSHRLETLDRET